MPRKGGEKKPRNLNGMGNLYFNKKTERYEYKIMVHGRIRMATGKTQKIVNERKKALEETPENKAKIKLYKWIETWLNTYVKPFKKASTHKQYEDTWKCYIRPYMKNVPLRTVTTMDLQMVIAELHNRKLSAYTMKQARKVMNLAFSRAKKEKYITSNPAEDIEIPDVQQKARKTLSIGELISIFNYLDGSRWYWPVMFMMVTGLRRGELLALKWSDIDEVNRIITVSDNLTDFGVGTTKSNKVHYVSLSKIAQKCLKEFKARLEKEANHVFSIDGYNGIIFVGRNGEPIKPHSFNNVFRRIQKYVGIEASPHSMRHTFVYYCKNKLSLAQLKDILGHDVTTNTLDIYGDMLFDTSEVAEKIDDAFDPVVSELGKKAVDNIVSFSDLLKRRAK